jgi:hypothetical protein
MAITIQTVISELSFIAQLADDNPKDPRLPQLVAGVKQDFATALKSVGGDAPITGG